MPLQSSYKRNKHRASRWPYVRKLAWERDSKAQAPCWICGQDIDYLAEPSTTPTSWEPDHDPPVSKHPEFELDLLHIKPSHKMCNRARGAEQINDLGKQSREW